MFGGEKAAIFSTFHFFPTTQSAQKTSDDESLKQGPAINPEKVMKFWLNFRSENRISSLRTMYRGSDSPFSCSLPISADNKDLKAKERTNNQTHLKSNLHPITGAVLLENKNSIHAPLVFVQSLFSRSFLVEWCSSQQETITLIQFGAKAITLQTFNERIGRTWRSQNQCKPVSDPRNGGVEE